MRSSSSSPEFEETQQDPLEKINRELSVLNRELNKKHKGVTSGPTFASLNQELDSLNSNLSTWLNDASIRADEAMLQSYTRPLESLFSSCSNYAGRWTETILSNVTSVYTSVIDAPTNLKKTASNKAQTAKNITTDKVVQLLKMVGTGLEAASMSDFKVNFSNIPSAIESITRKTRQYVLDSETCDTEEALESIQQLNSDTEGYFTGQEQSSSSDSCSENGSCSKAKTRRSSYRSHALVAKSTIIPAAVAVAVASRKKSFSKSKKASKHSDNYEADYSQQDRFDDEDEKAFAMGFKKSVKKHSKKRGKKCGGTRKKGKRGKTVKR